MSTALRNSISEPATDPIEFYDLLPGDPSAADLPNQPISGWRELFNTLNNAPLEQIKQSRLNNLTSFLLQNSTDAIRRSELRTLANHFSQLYVQALRERTEDVLKKMSMQRLNFFLRSILDSGLATDPASEITKLDYPCPWDWATEAETTIYVVSRRPNVIVRQNDNVSQRQLGLPTQIDPIGDGLFSVGSYYTDGGYRIDSGRAEFVPHNSPIVLQFRFNGIELFLDAKGRIYESATGRLHTTAPTSQVTRARRFNNLLYLMDWTVASIIHSFDLAKQRWQTHSIPDVFLPNDLLQLDEALYVIDKQQGFLFKFSPSFQLIDKKCGFGRGPGRLFDPIAIHASPDGSRLQVMNWVPANIVSVPRF